MQPVLLKTKHPTATHDLRQGYTTVELQADFSQLISKKFIFNIILHIILYMNYVIKTYVFTLPPP